MSGTIRFDDEHIVKFRLDAETMYLYLTVIIGSETKTLTINLTPDPVG